MSGSIQAIPVATLRKSHDPAVAPKVTVIRCVPSYENEEINWAVDQIVRGLHDNLLEPEIADLYLSTYRILSGVSNDPNDKNFNPKDQFPVVLETILDSDILILGACATAGFPHSNVVRLMERLFEYAEAEKEEKRTTIFNAIPTAVVTVGDCGAHSAGLNLAGAVNHLGGCLVKHGVAAWDKANGKVFKSQEFADTLDSIAEAIADLDGRRG